MEDHLSGETGVALIAADGRWTLVRGVRLLTSLAADVKTDDTILEHANAALRGHASSFKHTRADGRVYSCQLLPLAHGDAAFIITDISAQLAMRESAPATGCGLALRARARRVRPQLPTTVRR